MRAPEDAPRLKAITPGSRRGRTRAATESPLGTHGPHVEGCAALSTRGRAAALVGRSEGAPSNGVTLLRQLLLFFLQIVTLKTNLKNSLFSSDSLLKTLLLTRGYLLKNITKTVGRSVRARSVRRLVYKSGVDHLYGSRQYSSRLLVSDEGAEDGDKRRDSGSPSARGHPHPRSQATGPAR